MFEKCDKEKLLQSNHRITYRLIKSFGTTFASRFEAYYEVIYEDTPAQGYNMNCISDDLIFRIKENNFITANDEQELYDYLLWENIIIKYFNNEPYNFDEVEAVDNIIFKFKDIIRMAIEDKKTFLDIDSSVKVFYIIPLLIFCLEKGIEKVLK
jgi:hypothetical protein